MSLSKHDKSLQELARSASQLSGGVWSFDKDMFLEEGRPHVFLSSKTHVFFKFSQDRRALLQLEHTRSCSSSLHVFVLNKNACALVEQ